jgi:hypothetical protein
MDRHIKKCKQEAAKLFLKCETFLKDTKNNDVSNILQKNIG